MFRNRPESLPDAAQEDTELKYLPIIGVLGSGADLHVERSAKLGAWLGTLDVHLLTGGGGGVMLSVSQAFVNVANRAGLAIGVIPGSVGSAPDEYQPRDGYPNPWVELPLFTHLPDSGRLGLGMTSRNHINVLSSDVLIVLPGQLGTASEAELAVRYKKPIIAWLDDRTQNPGLHPDITVVKQFKKVQKFVVSNLPS